MDHLHTKDDDSSKLLTESARNKRINLTGTDIPHHREREPMSKKKKKILISLAVILLIIGIVLAIVLPLTLGGNNDNPDNSNPFDYQEYSAYNLNQSNITTNVNSAQFILNLKSSPSAQTNNFKSFMKLQDSAINGASYTPVNPSDIIDADNNNWASQVRINVDTNSNNQAHITVINDNMEESDLQKRRVQDELLKRPGLEPQSRKSQLGFTYKNDSSGFYFSFANIYTGDTLISTKNRKLLVSDQFSEMGFVLPTKKCFGLGQRNGQFALQPGTYSMHARGRQEGLPKDNQLGGTNGNHIHPFVLCQAKTSTDFFGMFFVSTAPQVFEIIQFANQDQMILNYITLGGPIEIFTFIRGSAQSIISMYNSLVGHSAMLPYYSLGLYQGSTAYNGLQKVKDTVSGYQNINVALEGIILENYSNGPQETFTVSSDFADISNYIKTMQSNNQKMILGASYVISNSQAYKYYNNALSHSCIVTSFQYIRKNLTGVLSNTTVFYLDAFHDGFSYFLSEVIPEFQQTVGNFDGLLVKDSSLPNTINGEVNQTAQATLKQKRQLLVNEESVGSYVPYKINKEQGPIPSTYDMAFLPDYVNSKHLDNMTISLNGTHSKRLANQYVHNGVSQRAFQRTQDAFSNLSDNRPFLLTDASWSGSGSIGAAVVTDIYRSWDNLKNVINQAFQLASSGVANIMVDTCGSIGPMDEELCARWSQLTAFMPQIRNYYNDSYLDTNSGVWMTTPPSEIYNIKEFGYQFAMSSAVNLRLLYTRYIYTQLYLAHSQSNPIVKPLYFDYPSDDRAFANIDISYMIGDSILVSPILDQGLQEGDTFKSYFPQSGVWVDLVDPTNLINMTTSGDYVSLNASNASINLHLKPGKIIPYQLNVYSAKTTTDLQQKQKTIIRINPDSQNYADGYLLIDDGISKSSDDNKEYILFKMRYTKNTINFWVHEGDSKYEAENLEAQYLDYIEIFNSPDLEDVDFACYINSTLNPVNISFNYNPSTSSLQLKPQEQTSGKVKFSQLGMIQFGNSEEQPNLCLESVYQYSGVYNATLSNETHSVYLLKNKGSTLMEQLMVEIDLLDDSGTIKVEITTLSDFNSGKTKIFQVPQPEVYDMTYYSGLKKSKKLTEFGNVTTDPFSFQVFKDSTDESLLYTFNPNKLYFSDYMVIESSLFNMNLGNSKPLLGMGEKAGSLLYQNEDGGIHTRYTFDQSNPIDDGKPPGKNFYGFQPFYAYQASTKDWVGIFDLNPYATDYIITTDINDGKNTSQINKISIGGRIQKFIFSGSKIDEVVTKYQRLVGMPSVPPLWAFGWNQCRWGWTSSDIWWNVYVNYTQVYDLPLDTMWADIDYMDDYKIFTISNTSYANFTSRVNQVKSEGRAFVPILDPGIAIRKDGSYKAYEDGLKQNVFVMTQDNSQPLTSGVWPGNVHFPDFMGQNTVNWWHDSLDYLHSDEGLGLKFDGIWLDMNEATAFCNGYCDPTQVPQNPIKNKIPYIPGQRDIETSVMGIDGWHPSVNASEYNLHNYYGLFQSKASSTYLSDKLSLRPYVLSRSNFPGLGKYAHHWLGDNDSTVKSMALSVDGLFSYQLFGLPFIGSDICGFNKDAASDLCTRYHQLGSFYPFSRNHNANGAKDQEPYRFNTTISNSSDVTYTDLIRTALIRRYSLIKYYYSNFHSIGDFGGTFFKPLFFEFQDDNNTYDSKYLENNIMLGEALKLSIQVQTLDFVNNATTEYYFPSARWCQIMPIINASECYDTSDSQTSKIQTLNSTLEDYQVHIRGGYIIPYQDAIGNKVRKTKDLENNSTDLFILTNTANSEIQLPTNNFNASAVGYIYFDDGVTNTNISRFEMYVSTNDDATFDVFVKSTSMTGQKRNLQHETIGTITFLWASKNNMQNLNQAKVRTGLSTFDLRAPVYDQERDTLNVTMISSDEKNTWTFWDLPQITLSQKQ